MPHLAAPRGAVRGRSRRRDPAGLPPGSDVGNLSILGYDPAEYHTGRAPIEAAAMGVDLAPDEVAYRCNLVTVDDAGTMVDFAAGHLTSEQSHPIIAALDAELGDGRDGVRFHPGVEYRHLCVVPRDLGDAECVPPHDLTGRRASLPTGPAAAKLIGLMDASQAGGAGRRRRGRLDGHADLALGPGHAAAASRLRRPLRRRRPALVGGRPRARPRRALRHRGPRCGRRHRRFRQRLRRPARRRARLAWPTATSSCSTSRPPTKPDTRVRSTRRCRRSSAGTPRSSVRSSTRSAARPTASCSCPTTRRPCARRTHTSDPVPYLLFDNAVAGAGGDYSERGVAGREPVVAHELMARLVG